MWSDIFITLHVLWNLSIDGSKKCEHKSIILIKIFLLPINYYLEDAAGLRHQKTKHRASVPVPILAAERCHYPPSSTSPACPGVTIDYEYLLSTYFKWMAGVEPSWG